MRTTGAPNVYKDDFSGSPGKGVLVIKNGEKKGKHRVTSAVVFVNGIQVLGPCDFKQAKYLMEVPVDLKKKNRLRLELRSKPGTYLTVEVVKVDADRPAVRLDADPETILAGKHSTLTWSSTNADSCVIEPGIGNVEANGSLIVAPVQTTAYTITATGPGGVATDEATVTVITNDPPSISIVRPHEEGEDPADCGFNIQWTDEDEDDNASISLYYDADGSGADGVLIADGLPEDPDEEGDRYSWDTTDVAEGRYYVYAVIDNGLNDPVTSYSRGPLEIIHDNADETKIFAEDADTQDEFGKSVSVSGDYAMVGADCEDTGGADSGAVYIFKRECNRWVEQAKLVSADAGENDHFGKSVSISGDYAIVGAYQHDESGADSGAAYVFIRSGENWTQQAKLIAGDEAANDYFGYAVSISGGYAIVGAYQCNGGQGAAYVFKREGDTWEEQAKLVTNDTECRSLGWSVHINSEYAIAGAPGYSGDHSGSAYIFKREADAWIEQTRLAGDSPRFGYSVAVGDSYAVVGAPRQEWEYDRSGEALVFKREASSWTEQVRLSAEDPMKKPLFGISVGLDENRIMVGSYGFAPATAYIYEIENDHWAYRYKFSDNMSDYTFHGYSVAINGRHVIVGAYGNDQANSNAGAAYIHDLESRAKKPSIALVESDGADDPSDCSVTLKWTDEDSDDNARISLYYDLDGSGEDGTLIVDGLPEDPDGDENIYIWNTTEVAKGSFYIYAVIEDGHNDPGAAYSRFPVNAHNMYGYSKITANDPTDNFLGRFISISGDYAVMGSSGYNETGEAQIFKRNGHDWTEHAVLTAGGTDAGNRFGCSGAINGEYVIVGAYQDNERVRDAGAAYVFRQNGDAWIRQAKLMADDAQSGDYFGNSVSISGNYALVGAWQDNDKGYYAGAAYIFKRSGDSWAQQAKLTASDGKPWENFGACVCISGEYAFVAANGDNYAGVVYVFKQAGDTWVQLEKLTVSDARALDYFGCSISVSGDFAIFGSRRWNGETGAYVFKRNDNSWVENAKLTAGDTSNCTSFGNIAAISGNHAVVSAGCTDAGGYFKYGASVFEYDGVSWKNIAKLAAPDPQLNEFGAYVAIDGDSIMVSVYEDNQNSAYVYETAPGDLSVDPTTVSMGQPTTLSWDFPDASSVTIDNGIGQVSSSGSRIVTINEPAVFTATAQGCWGTAVSSVTVAVEEPIAGIEADPGIVDLGQSSTLSWTTTNATSCNIEPGIGSVEANGSISVSPTGPTTYTLTATGPGGTTTAAVTVSIAAPTVILSAEPASVLIGNPSTLSWSSTNAVSCEIQPGIGTVGASGSISVSPTETTTYTITATGPGETATANATVTVMYPPTVNLNADSEVIYIGESVTLIWSSQQADSCTLDQGIGSVPISGSITVAPTETTTYTITASGPGGEISASVTVNCIQLAISITSPVNGNSLNKREIMVKGTIINPSGHEVGINVNGVPALIQGDAFLANHVPLEEGQNTITAVATDAEGNSVSASIAVLMEPEENYIHLTADPISGVTPFETTLTADGSFAFTAQTPAYTGPGVVEFLESAEENTFTTGITTPGIYYFTVETEFEGQIYSDTVAVQVMDESMLDALLRAKWNAMKESLISGNIEKALSYHQASMREKFSSIYTALGSDLPLLAEQMADISPVFFNDVLAKYRVSQDHEVNGQTVTITYYVYFSKDENGLWRIENY